MCHYFQCSRLLTRTLKKMTWIYWVALANISIMCLEYVYRIGWATSFFGSLHILIIPIMLGQIGLFYGFRLAPSLFLAGAVFTLMNLVLRSINVLVLKETFGVYQILGLIFMIIATLLFKVK